MFSIFGGGAARAENEAADAYGFTFEALTSDTPIQLSDYRDQVILVVNTASECGFTQQYEGLEALYQRYQEQGLVIIGVPSNDFGGQEPGSNEEIATFCKANFGVTFPMAAKSVVTGDEAHPFYLWAREKLGFLAKPKWNFHKYLINRQGEVVDYFHSTTAPDSARLQQAIEKALQG
ncbi:MAG: glutathione peroxidase [Rickettsiales bacterium]|nr:glutathione peroxidase [Rickettsiales bacterium]|tara:strand:- start:2530 stop:3060 length:531 start_codon:yes stop_codon:yes gene_type:complete